MRLVLIGLATALLAVAAWADSPLLTPGTAVPERIVPLGDTLAFRLTGCNVVGSFEQPQVSRICDQPVPASSTPVALREVQVHTAPYAEQPGQQFWAAQCWVRVHFSEDGLTFREIAKFSWPPGDFHSINHVLAVPIGVRHTASGVLRAIVGITSIAPDECRVEVKVYGTRL